MSAEIINLFGPANEPEPDEAEGTMGLFPDLFAALDRLTIRPKP
ncbi:hypothetical protein [Plantibacter sp. M259]|nr:hypothetical protein [Plantibacter sp. M259]